MDNPIPTAPVPNPSRPRPRRLRRVFLGLGLIAAGLAALVAALPTLLGTGPGRALVVRVANGQLAPSRITLDRVSLGWTRPIELGGVALIDAKGKTVVAAERVRTDRGLLALARSGGNYGTITVDGARLDVERRADGSIDVLEAIAPLSGPSDPNQPASDPAVVVTVAGGSFRLRTPEIPGGLNAPAFQAKLTLAAGQPADTTATLVDGAKSLTLRIVYDHHATGTAPADLRATLSGRDWPVVVAQAGVVARGRYAGQLDAGRKAGLWTMAGAAELRDAAAEGPALAGDKLALARVGLEADVAQAAAGWSVRQLELTSGVAGLRASGTVPPSAATPTHLDANADLAALARMLPHLLPLRPGLRLDKGTAKITADLVAGGDADRLDVSASLADLAGEDNGRPLALREPATLAGTATRSGGKVRVDRFAIKAAGIDANAQGDLEAGVTLDGTVDLAATEAQVRQWLDLGELAVAGRARVKADYRHKGAAYEARFAAAIAGPSIAGLPSAPGPIARDQLRLEGTADGPSTPLGLPGGWTKARVAVIAPDARLDANATLDAGNLAASVGVAAPITSPIPARVEASASARWPVGTATLATGLPRDIDRARLVLTPADPALAGAKLAFDVRGHLDLAAGTAGLVPLTPADPQGAVGLGPEGIAVSGLNQPGRPMVARAALVGEFGALDQALAAWAGQAPRGLAGHYATTVSAHRTPDGVVRFDGGAMVDHLHTGGQSRGPVTLAIKGGYNLQDDFLQMEAVDLSTRFGRLTVQGNVAKLTGDGRMIEVSGTLEPRWEAVDKLVAASVEPNAQVRGKIRPFRVAGAVPNGSASEILKGLDGEVGIDLESARAFGMTLGAAPVVLRMGGGKAAFDPIRTSLNEGTVAMGLDLGMDDPARLDLRIAPGSKIENAAINEAVSHDVLSYIAPVLSQSTQVRGRVSVAFDAGAVVPLVGEGSPRAGARARFEHVAFQPGPFVADVMQMANLSAPKLELDQDLAVKVADGRVHQSGLQIDAGPAGKVQVDGSVGLDKTLALRAALPINARMLGNDRRATQIVGDTKITVPVGGTLSRPQLDRRAFEVALRDAAKSVVRRGVRNELGQALDRVIPGAGDAARGAPAPGTAAGTAPGQGQGQGQGARGGTGRGTLEGEALKVLQGVGRDLLEPKRKP